MGSFIEFNDTLQITTEQGFPPEITLERHIMQPFKAADFTGRVFEFKKPGVRLYHPAPTRVFLVHNIDGKWLYWGKILITEQTIDANAQITHGRYIITAIYPPEHQRNLSRYDVPEGCVYEF